MGIHVTREISRLRRTVQDHLVDTRGEVVCVGIEVAVERAICADLEAGVDDCRMGNVWLVTDPTSEIDDDPRKATHPVKLLSSPRMESNASSELK